jgi:hypothetical protein
MIIMTPTQANGVRGLTVIGHAIAPKPFVASGAARPVCNGNFGLPEETLTDEHHLLRRIELAGLPTLPSGLIPEQDWLTITETSSQADKDLVSQSTYSSSWPVGELIIVNR